MPNPSETPESQPMPPEPIVPDPLIPPDPLVFPDSAMGENTPEGLPSLASGAQPHPLAMTSANSAPAMTTQLQQFSARLLHLQTTNVVELPPGLPVIHIGKPNDRIPPDIDVSGYPDSEIVSRIHADIRAEGDAYYIEDVGSSNGTYINNVPLPMGDRHRLRAGDRISLGKGDKVTFLFQMA
ncbi:FHA domain-containing protein [Myxacorys almedinensis]